MPIARIRFVTSKGAVSDAIRRAEYGFWCSHTEIWDDTAKGWLGARMGSGVSIEPDGYDKDTLIKEEIVLVCFTDEQWAKGWGFLKAQIGKDYDLTAVCAFAAAPIFGDHDWREDDSWFCSELEMGFMVASGRIPDLGATTNHFTPRDAYFIARSVGELEPVKGTPT